MPINKRIMLIWILGVAAGGLSMCMKLAIFDRITNGRDNEAGWWGVADFLVFVAFMSLLMAAAILGGRNRTPKR